MGGKAVLTVFWKHSAAVRGRSGVPLALAALSGIETCAPKPAVCEKMAKLLAMGVR